MMTQKRWIPLTILLFVAFGYLIASYMFGPRAISITTAVIEDNMTNFNAPMLTIPRTGASVPVPTTDDEAMQLLDYADTILTHTMRGLYRTYRAQGNDVLNACTKTLVALLDADKTHQHTFQNNAQ